MKLLDIYKKQVIDLNYDFDEEQVSVISELQRISDELILQEKKWFGSKSFLSKIKNKVSNLFSSDQIISGLYLYGGVGLGKTFLVDLFFNNLNIKQKKRIHFHALMKEFHEELKKLENISNPVEHYIKKFALKYKILVLDEFIVEDIADAMILYNILKSFIKYKIVLVTTSNTKPDDLYKNGIQREYFLSAIELIKDYNTVVHVEGNKDYRRQFLSKSSKYHICSSETNQIFAKYFAKLSSHHYGTEKKIFINNREIDIINKSPKILWINFNSICGTNRSADDFIEIVKIFRMIIISDIPVLNDTKMDSTKRFINLIDVLYDNQVSIILSSYSQTIEEIYIGKSLSKDFMRTKSRIFEMTNKDFYF